MFHRMFEKDLLQLQFISMAIFVFLFVVSWQKSLLNELESGLVIITDFFYFGGILI